MAFRSWSSCHRCRIREARPPQCVPARLSASQCWRPFLPGRCRTPCTLTVSIWEMLVPRNSLRLLLVHCSRPCQPRELRSLSDRPPSLDIAAYLGRPHLANETGDALDERTPRRALPEPPAPRQGLRRQVLRHDGFGGQPFGTGDGCVTDWGVRSGLMS